MLRVCVVAVVLAVATASSRPAHAYEFWLDAKTIGQAYQLRKYSLVGPDLFLMRRRYTQTLALRIWDIGDLSATRRLQHLPDRGLRISWQSYIRIDHDFGDYTGGSITVQQTVPVNRDALDVIPELGESVASLDLLYGYLQLDGLVDDRLSVQIGRLLIEDGWETGAQDGAAARFELPVPLAVSASAGLRVRASSPLGVGSFELDGTSGAGCQEYVEGPTPGTGTWKLIDRNRAITNTPLASDYEYCPQRDVDQPTIGVTISTSRTRNFGAELGYRRTWSDTVGLIGAPNRLDYPDLGLYPNDYGQAPKTGVDEERLWARVHAELKAGDVAIAPYANVRYSLLNAELDRVDAGVQLRRGDHTLEPVVEYFYPTFDGDSIFNVFSIEPTTDARLNYRFAPSSGLHANATAWLRHYANDDSTSSYAGGFDAGLERDFAASWRGKLDGLYDDGFGGRRAGGTAEVAWRPDVDLWLRGRAIVLGVRDDQTARALVTSSAVVSSTWKVAEFVALHGIAESDHDAVNRLQLRFLAIIDLAFIPEM